MKLLAFDTSSTACSVALLIDNEVKAVHKIMPMQQAQFILPMLHELLDQNKILLNQLDAICFGCGPGSFTGVRIAASVAQGLGFATGLPLIPISSLAAAAQAAHDEFAWQKCLVSVDARINEVYWGAYITDETGLVRLLGSESVSSPLNVVIPEGLGWYGVGNGWEVYRDQIPYQPIDLDLTGLPTASAILRLAKEKWLLKQWVQAKDALPVYLRDEVAKKMR